MNISCIDGNSRNVSPIGAGEDAKTKNIKEQIARVQKKLQDLAANEDISLEEKMKKRQELQKQLGDLNSQLRQCQSEQRRKASEAEKRRQESDNSMGGQAKAGKKQGDPAAEVILTADAALRQAKMQDGVIAKQKGRAGVLKAEIKLDSSRGRSVEAKQEELAEVEARMAETQGSQMENLNRANQAIEENREADGTPKTERQNEEKEAGRPDGTGKTGSSQTVKNQTEKIQGEGIQLEKIQIEKIQIEEMQAEKDRDDKEKIPGTEEENGPEREAARYRPINILL